MSGGNCRGGSTALLEARGEAAKASLARLVGLCELEGPRGPRVADVRLYLTTI